MVALKRGSGRRKSLRPRRGLPTTRLSLCAPAGCSRTLSNNQRMKGKNAKYPSEACFSGCWPQDSQRPDDAECRRILEDELIRKYAPMKVPIDLNVFD